MNEKTVKNRNYFYIIMLGLLLFACYYLFSGGDNGNRADDVRAELNAIGKNQQSIADGITNVEGTADSIAGSIGESQTAIGAAESTVTELESSNRTAGQLIAECQQIIERVRSRDEGKTAKP